MHRPIRAAAATLAVAASTMTGCTTSAASNDDPAAVRQAVETSNTDFAEALRTGAYDRVAGKYTEDAVLLPPNAPAASGRAAIQQVFAGLLPPNASLTDFRLTTTDVEVSGAMARERGRYNLSLNMPGQPAVSDSGKYLVVWERQEDGSWLMESDIWNSDIPVPSPETPASSAPASGN